MDRSAYYLQSDFRYHIFCCWNNIVQNNCPLFFFFFFLRVTCYSTCSLKFTSRVILKQEVNYAPTHVTWAMQTAYIWMLIFMHKTSIYAPVLFSTSWQAFFASRAAPQEVKEILQSHAAVFTEELECLKGQQVHLHVQENASPKFCKARRAAPIVPVVESDGSVRICGVPYKAKTHVKMSDGPI